MTINNLTVRARLALGFGVITVVMLALGVMGLVRMSQIEARLNEVVDVNVYKMQLLEDMSTSVHIVQRVVRTLIILRDPALLEREAKKIVAARKVYDAAFANLEKTAASDEGASLRRKTHEAQEGARAINDALMSFALANKEAEAADLLVSKGLTANQKWLDVIQENVNLQSKATAADAAEARAAYESARRAMVLLSVLGIVAALVAGYGITRSLTRQLGGEPSYAAQLAERIAEGDLTVTVQLRAGDTSSLLYAISRMRDSLANITAQVRDGADAMASAASQIASGNADLSSRTEEQASSLGETATSMDQLNATVKANSDSAHQANHLAGEASKVALQGGEAVARVVQTMASIQTASRKIMEIISVIDGIAFQTNILALNAAVEAARAGEQGRGFAVVASEVRMLAQRSASAAKEIKALIDSTVSQVETGSGEVKRAGETMDRVVESVRRVTSTISEISSASTEQTIGIGQVSQAVAQMDEVTQQNAALVEKAAAASEALLDQARQLSDLVNVFKLTSSPASTPGLASASKVKRLSSQASIPELLHA
jgi:methyl-accepting chemotaxis protein